MFFYQCLHTSVRLHYSHNISFRGTVEDWN